MGELRNYRMDIGVEILLDMKKNNEFPFKSKIKLAKTMMEYFYKMGYEDKVYEDGYTWTPDVEYWVFNITGTKTTNGITEVMYEGLQERLRRKHKLFLCYVHTGKGFKGSWKFVNKDEFVSQMERCHGELNTRIDSYNEKVLNGNYKWERVNLPLAQPVPALR